MRVAIINALKLKSSREAPIVGYAKGSDVVESLTKVVGVNVSVLTRIATHAVKILVGNRSD